MRGEARAQTIEAELPEISDRELETAGYLSTVVQAVAEAQRALLAAVRSDGRINTGEAVQFMLSLDLTLAEALTFLKFYWSTLGEE